MRARLARGVLAAGLVVTLAAACDGSGQSHSATTSTASSSRAPAAPVRSSNTPAARSTTTAPGTSTPPRSTSTDRRPSKSAAPSSSRASAIGPARAPRPVIVLDPGHSPGVTAIDPATGLNVSDYENEPEMRDVFAVALLVRTALRAAGYRVVMTKTSATQRVSLGERAHIADRAHAALALSIHDQAGADGGLPFAGANNIVYYQSVGTYRATAAGHRVYFTDTSLAAASKRYGAIFQTARAALEHHDVRLQDNVGYDLGSRGLAAGNIWLVQLLSHVPWIYNEAGGNSANQVGLDATDEHRYAAGLVAAVERCVPIVR